VHRSIRSKSCENVFSCDIGRETGSKNENTQFIWMGVLGTFLRRGVPFEWNAHKFDDGASNQGPYEVCSFQSK
jgi:hypothetical protein